MNTHADPTQENKSQSVANGVSQVQSSSDGLSQFEDNRPEAAIQRKLQQIANNSPKAMQLKAFQEMTNPHSQPTAQLEEMEDGDSKPQQKTIEKPKNNTGLPDNLKSGIENLSGYSMDDVKVHRNSAKPAKLQAHAYAQGSEIHLASGQEKHLPHEAWHVVQQKQGRVKPTKQLKGQVNVNNDKGLEQEADVMGGKAAQLMLNSTPKIDRSFDATTKENTVQRYIIAKDGSNIWSTEIAHRLSSEKDDKIKEAVQRLHSIDSWIKVDTYDQLVKNIKDEVYKAYIQNSIDESPEEAKYKKPGPDILIESRKEQEERGLSEMGRLSREETIYKSDGPTDPYYKSRIKKDEKGRNSLKLGWGSAAHIIEVNGSYFLKKLVIGGSVYNPDKIDIMDNWKGTYNDSGDGLEVTFNVTSEGGDVQLSEIITFGVSTCSFSVVCDAGLKNIILMHINNGDPLPFDKFYENSPEFRQSMTRMFVSMIDEETEVNKILKATRSAGIEMLDVLSRPYDAGDADRINMETHHSIGLNLEEAPTLIGEQGDSESIYKAVISKICKKAHDDINSKLPWFGEIEESHVQTIYREMHDGLQNLGLESIELNFQIIDWQGRLKAQGNIKESNERRAIFGASAAYQNPSGTEIENIKVTIRKLVDRRLKGILTKQET